MAIAGHRQNAEELVRWPAGTAHFPPSNGIGAVARLKAAQLCHIGSRQRPADRVGEILTELLQLGTCLTKVWRLSYSLRLPQDLKWFSADSASVPAFARSTA